MRVLGLDASLTATGYAVLDERKAVLKTGLLKFAREKSAQTKIVELTDALSVLALKYKVDRVVIEDIYYGRNAKSFKQLARLEGALIYKFTKMNLVPTFVLAVKARKVLGLKGTVDKLELMLYWYKLLNLLPQKLITEVHSEFSKLRQNYYEGLLTKRQLYTRMMALCRQLQKIGKVSHDEADALTLAYYPLAGRRNSVLKIIDKQSK